MDADGNGYARRCRCLRRAIFRGLVPDSYRRFNLARLKGRPDIYAGQNEVFNEIRAEPTESYFIAGRNRVGKSIAGWCLVRHAVIRGQRIAALNLAVLLDQYRAWEKPIREDETPPKPPAITAQALETGQPWTVMLQEFDKPRPTEYGAEKLFELIDAAVVRGHQLIITSNLDPAALDAHWGRVAPRYGSSIVSRIVEHCQQVLMF